MRETRGILDFLLGRFKTCGNCRKRIFDVLSDTHWLNSSLIIKYNLFIVCGRPNRFGETRFLGGEYTKVHEFPWLANIHAKSKFLSGVLINDRYVLSSASQLIGFVNWTKFSLFIFKLLLLILKEKKFVNIICSVTAAEVKVSLGEYDLCNLDVSSSTISVESLILYPEYNIESHAHNLALIKLSQTVKFERRLSPICLPNPGMYFTYLIFIINFFCFILLFFK